MTSETGENILSEKETRIIGIMALKIRYILKGEVSPRPISSITASSHFLTTLVAQVAAFEGAGARQALHESVYQMPVTKSMAGVGR